MHNGLCHLQMTCLREPLVLIHSHPKPRVTEDALQIKCSWILTSLSSYFRCSWVLPVISLDSTQDDDFKPPWWLMKTIVALAMITTSPTPLFCKGVSKPANLQVGSSISFVEKNNGLWSTAALDPEPPFTLNWLTGHSPGCPMSTGNLRSGSVARVKPAAAIHICNWFWILIWKHHFLLENSHWESTYSLITCLE